MKLPVAQRVVVALMLVVVMGVSLARALPSLAWVLYLTAILAVVAAFVIEAELLLHKSR